MERAYRYEHELQLRGVLRGGLIFSLIVWAVVIGMAYFIRPEDFTDTALFLGGTTFPTFGFMIYATRRDRFIGYYHLFAAVSNILAGFILMVIMDYFPGGIYILLPSLISVIFFGLYMYRFRLIVGTTIAILYMVCFQVILLTENDLGLVHNALLIYLAWQTVAIAAFAGHVTEKSAREAFVSRRVIAEQKGEIERERQKSERLLENMLPDFIADRLKQDETVIADHHEHATVLFADLVGFTGLSEKIPPQELVRLLNRIFSAFDELTEAHGVEKIKTIGDAYLAAGGLGGRAHRPEALIRMAQDMLRYIRGDAELQGYGIRIRIGIHTGPAVAGVIGLKKYTYDLWGDTVNTASRMESHGEPGRIHVSDALKKAVEGHFSFEPRGVIEVKGKGTMQTWFVGE